MSAKNLLPRRILVPFDFSAPSQRACDHAVDLAEAVRASIALVNVVHTDDVVGFSETAKAAVLDTAKRNLERAAHFIRPHVAEVETIVEQGEPWRRIEATALDRLADLIVMGTHGRRGVSRALLGSVAEKVVRTSSVPVMTIPATAFATRGETGEALARAVDSLDLTVPFVVALSRKAIPLAAPIAAHEEGTLDLFVIEPILRSDGRVMGAVAEDDVIAWEPDATTSAMDRDAAVIVARDRARAEAFALKGARTVGECWKRPVVLVADGVFGESAVSPAVDAFRKLGAEKIVVATPTVSRAALERMEGKVDSLLWLEKSVVAESITYRDDVTPSDLVARELLDALRASKKKT